MQVNYSGTKGNVLRYSCHQAQRMQSAEQICQSLGGKKLDQAVVDLFLQTITPARVHAIITALEQAEEHVQAEKLHWQKQLEKARYEAERAKRQYDRVEPENRLVARAMEKAWEERLGEVERLEQILREKESQAYHPLTAAEKKRMESLDSDLRNIWTAETTTSKDRKELLRTLISEIIVLVNRDDHAAQCTILWEGGAHSTFTHRLNRTGRHNRCTDEEIVELVRKLANHYPDEMIARILNRQHLKTGQGNSFTAGRICSLRHHHGISKYMGSSPDTESELYNVEEAAKELKVSKATLLRWLREGFIRGVQLTPGAPWQIDITEELRTKIVPTVPDGWVPLNEAAFALGCTKQTVLNRMRSGL